MFLYKVTNNVKFVDLAEECPSTSGVTLKLRDANATDFTGDGNEKAKIGQEGKTTSLHVHHAFYISYRIYSIKRK